MDSISDKCIVLIIGQPKAGTTSLFDWLAQNPAVAPGKIKELRFFLDPDYPLQTAARYNGNNLDQYLELFQAQDRKILLDASPDYMGSSAALTLGQKHADTKAILLVREPVERMLSAFRYYKALGRLPGSMSFESYVEHQERIGVKSSTPSEFRALDHCRVEHYVKRWKAAYGENFIIVKFEEIRNDPNSVLSQVYNFLGLDPVYLECTNFKHSNKTRASKYPRIFRIYAAARAWFAIATLKAPFLYALLKPLGAMVRQSIEDKSETEKAVEVSHKARELILKHSQS